MTIHEKCGRCVDAIMKCSLVKRTQDNITVVMIAFQNFNQLFGSPIKTQPEDFLVRKWGAFNSKRAHSSNIMKHKR